jgi:multisubunit Na+/H+ antiporter MnhB subunit
MTGLAPRLVRDAVSLIAPGLCGGAVLACAAAGGGLIGGLLVGGGALLVVLVHGLEAGRARLTPTRLVAAAAFGAALAGLGATLGQGPAWALAFVRELGLALALGASLTLAAFAVFGRAGDIDERPQ